MGPKHKKIKAIWEDVRSMISGKEISINSFSTNELVSSFFCPGPFYYYVLDFSVLDFSFLHPNLRELLGLDPDNFEIADLLNSFHPDDLSHIAHGERMFFEFMNQKISRDKIKKYKTNYCFRIKTANDQYRLFMQQVKVLSTDEGGNIIKILGVHADISHITTINNYKISFVGFDEEPSFLDVDTVAPNDPNALQKPLTVREVQIAKLLAEGFNAEEIGKRLSISQNTVRTHRKNMLLKTKSRNTMALVAQCYREGLI